MPGRFRKPPIHQPPDPSAVTQSLPHVSNVVRRATNLNRLERRIIRRQSVRQAAEKVLDRPRPSVRPAQPLRRVIPNNHPPARMSRSGSRPSVPPLTTTKTRTEVDASIDEMALSTLALDLAKAHNDISSEAGALQRDLENLREVSTLSEIRSDMANLDAALHHALELLEAARDKDFRYQDDLEELAAQATSQWESIRPRVRVALSRQSKELQVRLKPLVSRVNRLNAVLSNPTAATPILQTTHTQVNGLLREAQRVQWDLESQYSNIESQLQDLNQRLTRIHWALDQLGEAKFRLDAGEDLIMAVPARWDQEDKDDPEGVLYLTNRSLVFERKEKVATKKVLFITTASELVQEVLIKESIKEIISFKAASKGLFGHQDFLEVQFQDPALNTIWFHLDGQDSKHWAVLLETTKTGVIEDQRISGSGISYTDLSKPINREDLLKLQNEVNQLQDEMMLSDVRHDLAELDHQVHSMERKLAEVRARGYALERDLEADVAVLKTQWERNKANTETIMEQQTGILGGQMGSIQKLLAQLTSQSAKLSASRPLYLQIKSAIASAEAQADAAGGNVLAQYDAYADEVESLMAHLEWADWMLEALATASFRLLASESGVAAAEASWSAPGLPPENGILFLTDQRLLWEDRVDTYELKVNIPLQQINTVIKEVTAEEENEELVFNFGPGAPLINTRFRLSMPVADSWLQMIGRARSGDYAQDRAVPIDESELQRIRSAPRQCPNCGAAFTLPILRGQMEIICEYCGVRVGIA